MDEKLKSKVLSDEELSKAAGGFYPEDRIVEDWHYCPKGHLANNDYEESDDYMLDENGKFMFKIFYCSECQRTYSIRL